MLTYLENVDFADASYASSRRNLRDCPLQDGEHYDENLRMEVIDWMLEALPPLDIRDVPRSTLHEQLTISDETRFRAAYILTRYFLRLSSPASSPSTGVIQLLCYTDPGTRVMHSSNPLQRMCMLVSA